MEVAAERGRRVDGDVSAANDHRRDDALNAIERVRDAVEMLAGDWPQYYPLEAVKWHILDGMERPAA
jgi:hypothetical protein